MTPVQTYDSIFVYFAKGKKTLALKKIVNLNVVYDCGLIHKYLFFDQNIFKGCVYKDVIVLFFIWYT